MLGKRNFGTVFFFFSKYSRTTAMCSRSSSASSGEISTSRAVPVFVWFLTWRPAMAFETLIAIRPNLRSKGVRASASLGRMPVLASVMNRPEKIGACTSFLHPLPLIPAAFCPQALDAFRKISRTSPSMARTLSSNSAFRMRSSLPRVLANKRSAGLAGISSSSTASVKTVEMAARMRRTVSRASRAFETRRL